MPEVDISKLESLARILEQERAGGFQDSTVIGGLDRFLQRWARDIEPVAGKLGSYSLLTPPQRRSWAEPVLGRLDEMAAADGDGAARRPRHPTPRPKAKARTVQRLTLGDDVARLTGVSTKLIPKLKRLGVHAIEDMLYLFPHRHNDFGNVAQGVRVGVRQGADGGRQRLGGVRDQARTQAKVDPGGPRRRHGERPGYLVQQPLSGQDPPARYRPGHKRKGERLQG